MGLEKHVNHIQSSGEKISRKQSIFVLAATRLAKDTIIGKTKRRVYDYIRQLRDADYYNPVKVLFCLFRKNFFNLKSNQISTTLITSVHPQYYTM